MDSEHSTESYNDLEIFQYFISAYSTNTMKNKKATINDTTDAKKHLHQY